MREFRAGRCAPHLEDRENDSKLRPRNAEARSLTASQPTNVLPGTCTCTYTYDLHDAGRVRRVWSLTWHESCTQISRVGSVCTAVVGCCDETLEQHIIHRSAGGGKIYHSVRSCRDLSDSILVYQMCLWSETEWFMIPGLSHVGYPFYIGLQSRFGGKLLGI